MAVTGGAICKLQGSAGGPLDVPRSRVPGSGACARVLAQVVAQVVVCAMLALHLQVRLCGVAALLSPAERAALVDLYTNTSATSSPWLLTSGWAKYTNASADPCTPLWFGVACSAGPPSSVTYVVVAVCQCVCNHLDDRDFLFKQPWS